jgi:thiol-disulfide isomerase/thioredoxin
MSSIEVKRSVARLAVAVVIAAVLFGMFWSATPAASPDGRFSLGETAPEFPSTETDSWLNTVPLKLSDLRGKPVLVEFWTFGCSNCRATLPWLKAMHERHAKAGLVIVGVHSPEFDFERNPAAVAQAVDKLDIPYAVLLDNDFAYWNAYRNRYWPAFYLIDSNGKIVGSRIGELHLGSASADQFEREIVKRLAAQ